MMNKLQFLCIILALTLKSSANAHQFETQLNPADVTYINGHAPDDIRAGPKSQVNPNINNHQIDNGQSNIRYIVKSENSSPTIQTISNSVQQNENNHGIAANGIATTQNGGSSYVTSPFVYIGSPQPQLQPQPQLHYSNQDNGNTFYNVHSQQNSIPTVMVTSSTANPIYQSSTSSSEASSFESSSQSSSSSSQKSSTQQQFHNNGQVIQGNQLAQGPSLVVHVGNQNNNQGYIQPQITGNKYLPPVYESNTVTGTPNIQTYETASQSTASEQSNAQNSNQSYQKSTSSTASSIAAPPPQTLQYDISQHQQLGAGAGAFSMSVTPIPYTISIPQWYSAPQTPISHISPVYHHPPNTIHHVVSTLQPPVVTPIPLVSTASVVHSPPPQVHVAIPPIQHVAVAAPAIQHVAVTTDIPVTHVQEHHGVQQKTINVAESGLKTQTYEIRRPAIQKQFYDIEERVIVRPAGSVVVEIDHPLSKTAKGEATVVSQAQAQHGNNVQQQQQQTEQQYNHGIVLSGNHGIQQYADAGIYQQHQQLSGGGGNALHFNIPSICDQFNQKLTAAPAISQQQPQQIPGIVYVDTTQNKPPLHNAFFVLNGNQNQQNYQTTPLNNNVNNDDSVIINANNENIRLKANDNNYRNSADSGDSGDSTTQASQLSTTTESNNNNNKINRTMPHMISVGDPDFQSPPFVEISPNGQPPPFNSQRQPIDGAQTLYAMQSLTNDEYFNKNLPQSNTPAVTPPKSNFIVYAVTPRNIPQNTQQQFYPIQHNELISRTPNLPNQYYNIPPQYNQVFSNSPLPNHLQFYQQQFPVQQNGGAFYTIIPFRNQQSALQQPYAFLYQNQPNTNFQYSTPPPNSDSPLFLENNNNQQYPTSPQPNLLQNNNNNGFVVSNERPTTIEQPQDSTYQNNNEQPILISPNNNTKQQFVNITFDTSADAVNPLINIRNNFPPQDDVLAANNSPPNIFVVTNDNNNPAERETTSANSDIQQNQEINNNGGNGVRGDVNFIQEQDNQPLSSNDKTQYSSQYVNEPNSKTQTAQPPNQNEQQLFDYIFKNNRNQVPNEEYNNNNNNDVSSKSRVISATPAPKYAEPAGERVHTRRIVVNNPLETVQVVQEQTPITNYKQVTIQQPTSYKTASVGLKRVQTTVPIFYQPQNIPTYHQSTVTAAAAAATATQYPGSEYYPNYQTSPVAGGGGGGISYVHRA